MRWTCKLLFLSILLAGLAIEPCRCHDSEDELELSDEELFAEEHDQADELYDEHEEWDHQEEWDHEEELEHEEAWEQLDEETRELIDEAFPDEEVEDEHEEVVEDEEWDHKDDASPPLVEPAPVKVVEEAQPKKEGPSATQKDPIVATADLEVIQLTSTTFSKVTSDDNIWLIEFYADWCNHCIAFAPSYAEMARYFHSQPHLKIKVARVNVDRERALALRFGVRLFPSFYIIDQWSAYRFDQHRSKKNLMDFASGGYKKQASMPFYSSPMGPLGLAQGALISVCVTLSNVFYWLQSRFGLSSLVAGTLMFGSFFMGCFCFIVFWAIALTPSSKAKVD